MSFKCPLPIQETELRRAINQLITTNVPEPLLKEQIKNKANQLIKLAILDGYLARGILASVEQDINAVHSYYQQAMEHFSKKSEILASYATSLARLGYFSPAAEHMLEAYYLSPATINCLAEAMHLCGLAGRFHLVAELHRIWRQIRGDNPPYYAKILEELLELMNEKQVTDEDVETIINVALAILRKNNYVVTPEQVEMSLDYDNGKWFHYAIKVNDTLDMAIYCQKCFDEKWYRVHLPKQARLFFIPVFHAQIFGQPAKVHVMP